MLLQVQDSHRTESEGHDSVKIGSMVKHSYKFRLEVHSSATVAAVRSQVMPVWVPSSALESRKSKRLNKNISDKISLEVHSGATAGLSQ